MNIHNAQENKCIPTGLLVIFTISNIIGKNDFKLLSKASHNVLCMSIFYTVNRQKWRSLHPANICLPVLRCFFLFMLGCLWKSALKSLRGSLQELCRLSSNDFTTERRFSRADQCLLPIQNNSSFKSPAFFPFKSLFSILNLQIENLWRIN